MRNAILALLLAAAALAGLVLWWGESRTAPDAALPAPAEALAPEQAPEAAAAAEPATDLVVSTGPRRAPEEAAQLEAAPQAIAAEGGTLRVLVRSKDTGRPVAGARLILVPTESSDSWSATHLEGSSGRPGESPITDAEGRASFQVPLGEEYILRASAQDPAGPGALEIAAFDAPRVAEVVLEVSTQADLLFVGRVVDAEDRRPLADARVVLADGFPIYECDSELGSTRKGKAVLEELAVDPAGYFALELHSWSRERLEITAPGHGLALVERRSGHEDHSTALEIRLPRSATVNATVLAAGGGPLEGALVRLSTGSWELKQEATPSLPLSLGNIQWRGRTDARGRCRIEVPSGAPLTATCFENGEILSRKPAPIVLRAGEVHELVFELGAGAGVSGALIESGGRGAAGTRIWLKPADAAVPKYFQRFDNSGVTEAICDPQGRFSFEDVADGSWWVGPAPGSPYAPRAEVVQVSLGAADREVILTAYRDLHIGGTVLDPAGAPIARAVVFLTKEGEQVWINETTDAAGAFLAGPLAEGLFTVRVAASPEKGFSAPEPVEASAGERGLVLRMLPGGSLAGVVIDAETGRTTAAQILLTHASDDPTGLRMTWARDTGEFELGGLEPGTYHLTATANGKVAVQREVAVRAGAVTSDLLLQLEPGAWVSLSYTGGEPLGVYRVRSGEVCLTFEGVTLSGTRLAVPPGLVRIERRSGPLVLEAREVSLVAGEEREVVFGGEE